MGSSASFRLPLGRSSFPSLGALTLAGLVLVASGARGQTSSLDWDVVASDWDFLTEVPTDPNNLEHTYTDVDGSGIDVTLNIQPDFGTDLTSLSDPERDTVHEWLINEPKHGGIKPLFATASGSTLNLGISEGDRDDATLWTFGFEVPVGEVSFTVYDIDKVNWTGPLGFEDSGRIFSSYGQTDWN